MGATIGDKRLFAIRTIEDKSDIFETYPQQDMSNEKLYFFTSPVDHIMGGMFFRNFKDEEDEKTTIIELEKSLNGFRNSTWKYAEQVFHFYDTCHLISPVFEQCMRVLKADEETWFRWINGIPFTGIQCVFLQYSPSIQCLISFMQYLLQQPEESEKRDYLLSLVTLFFNEKLKTLERNLQTANASKLKEFEWNLDEWEMETDYYITKFVNLIFQLPEEQFKNLIFSFLSNIWINDKSRNKIENALKIKILKQYVAFLHTEEDVKTILFDTRWENNKNAILHKLFIYVEWTLEQNKKSYDCSHLLWQDVIACLETKSTYLHYNQPDDQLFSWIFGKLLADEPNPLGKIKSILVRYHQRYGVWNRDFEQVFQFQRARFFFLTTGAMAAEWLLREETQTQAETEYPVKCKLADEMIQYIFDESRLVIDGFIDGTKDELNFLQQFWARYALFQTRNTTEEETNKMLEALYSIDSIEYRFIAISDFLSNLAKENKGSWYYDIFAKRLLIIIEQDIEIVKYWNEEKLKEINKIVNKGTAIKKSLNCKNPL